MFIFYKVTCSYGGNRLDPWSLMLINALSERNWFVYADVSRHVSWLFILNSSVFVFVHCFAFATSSAKVLSYCSQKCFSACDTTDVLTCETCNRTVRLYEFFSMWQIQCNSQWMWSFDMLFRNDLSRCRALFYDTCWKAKGCFVTSLDVLSLICLNNQPYVYICECSSVWGYDTKSIKLLYLCRSCWYCMSNVTKDCDCK